MAERNRSIALARVILWISSVGTAAYSCAYIGGLRLSQGVPDCARQLQVAQLPSSFWIAISAGLGAFGLGRRRRWGLFMAIAAASAGLYIGVLDITFDLMNDVYKMPWSDLAPEIFANSVSTVVPAYIFYAVLHAPAWD